MKDEAFLLRLYTTVREPEFLLSRWSEAQKQAFIADQFRLQQAHYRQSCPDADYWLVQGSSRDTAVAAIGRMSLDRTGPEWRLMELALLPQLRNRGIGAQLIRWVQQAAQEEGVAVGLHVAAGNDRAARLYARLGFVEAPSGFVGHRFLRWHAEGGGPAREAPADARSVEYGLVEDALSLAPDRH